MQTLKELLEMRNFQSIEAMALDTAQFLGKKFGIDIALKALESTKLLVPNSSNVDTIYEFVKAQKVD